jgi:RNA polymerase sigma-54 factor
MCYNAPMSVSQRLEIKQGQSLVMTPQLQQAIKLLQLSNLELMDYVNSEIEQNPLLERADNPSISATESQSGTTTSAQNSEATPQQPNGGEAQASEGWMQGPEQFADWGRGGGNNRSFDDDAYSMENMLTKEVTLRDHLLEQVGEEFDDATERLIAYFLIDQLDEAGYLKETAADVAALLDADAAQIEHVRKRILQFDPLGIGAHNLAECLAVQLKERNRLDPAMQTLLGQLDLLASRDYKQLLKLCGVDSDDLTDMIAEIRELNPRPATGFATGPSITIQPDVLMRPSPAGGWIVELNPATLPRVLVNETYINTVGGGTARSKEDRDYLNEKMASANWLVKALHQRAETILKVASEIVRRQHLFFEKGVHHLKPMILKDIAEAIEMHESTISRVTSGKFLATRAACWNLNISLPPPFRGLMARAIPPRLCATV